MKKVSIVVPVYNVEKYMKRCLDSILAQTYTNLEIILVDDGSTDSSGEICDTYAEKDNRVVVIHKDNGGLSDARNVGIEKATGEYIAFIDSDDYIDLSMVQVMVEKLEATSSDIVLCNYEYVDEDGRLIDESNGETRVISEELTSEQALDRLCKANSTYYTIACNKIYKKEIFDKVRFRKGKLHEDEFIVHEIYARMNKMVCIEDGFYKYVQRNSSITNNNRTSRHLDVVEALFLRTQFFINTNRGYNAKHTLGMATGTFVRLVGMIKQKDDKYNKRVEELQGMCKEVFNTIPKKYFRCKLWVRCVLIIYWPWILNVAWIRKIIC